MASFLMGQPTLRVGATVLKNMSLLGKQLASYRSLKRCNEKAFGSTSGAFRSYSNVISETPIVEDNSSVTLEDLKKSGTFDKSLLAALEAAKFNKLTPVQSKSLLPIMEEENGLVVRAKTGTGKTLAFVVPTIQAAIEALDKSKKSKTDVSTLVIAPTRDLAMQIENEYKKVINHLPRSLKQKLSVAVVMGGKRTEFNSYHTPPIVIATPGRLNDKLSKPYFSKHFSNVQYRVYDEADRILDQGFKDTLDSIDKYINEARMREGSNKNSKSILFSATIDSVVSDFAKKRIGENYNYIDCVDKNEPEAHENITQVLVKTRSVYDSFNSSLNYIADGMKGDSFKAIVFLPTVIATDWYFSMLTSARDKNVLDPESLKIGSKVLRLHGKMSQAARDRTVRDFRKSRSGVLICTDVAARGLDFTDVSDVVQICPSVSVSDYIHKIGRTARAGSTGKATLFLSEYEQNYRKALEISRGIKFAEEFKSDDSDILQRPIINDIGVFEPDMAEFIKTYLSFQKQVQKAYRLTTEATLNEIVGFYRTAIQDPSARLKVSTSFLQNVYPVSRNFAMRYFDAPSASRRTPFNHSKAKRNFMDVGQKKRYGSKKSFY